MRALVFERFDSKSACGLESLTNQQSLGVKFREAFGQRFPAKARAIEHIDRDQQQTERHKRLQRPDPPRPPLIPAGSVEYADDAEPRSPYEYGGE
uniref:Uncharacterized protein n=1 Tax=Ralstonia solanacearum TaxID=305 RepID=A0A0S4U592_RALSL|nr:protein of unknown function [Ralstonia solanacearum]CUV27656.1 protein of unknown function [Ralstonia solanacearum]